ncbi:unnamed protein product [Adineta ricciae]|uniref:Carbonic anhydrase n=1 Tax=Adineta ricciae TaxID=249248 RepID=A0A814UEZ6_ADIRI|nr:unnamed protein product [Adineta ricciae]CAF1174851.1 unnamed protein product [Adineta ricciae]
MIYLIVMLIVLSQSVIADEWNYNEEGPDVWSDLYPACDGSSQSPIDVDTQTTSYLSFTRFQFNSGYNMAQNFTLKNTGHTIQATYTGNDSSTIAFVGGGLTGSYAFVNFHLHWGENYKSGSEHQVNGHKYTAELHLVHKNSVTGQIAVLGMFIQTVKQTNTTHEKRRKRDSSTNETSTPSDWIRFLIESSKLKLVNDTATLSLNLASLFTEDTENYWRYSGSFTTPPCTEGAIWTVFKTPILLDDSYFSALRHLISTRYYRGPQRLHGRTVYRSYPHEDPIGAADSIFYFTSRLYIFFFFVIFFYIHFY